MEKNDFQKNTWFFCKESLKVDQPQLLAVGDPLCASDSRLCGALPQWITVNCLEVNGRPLGILCNKYRNKFWWSLMFFTFFVLTSTNLRILSIRLNHPEEGTSTRVLFFQIFMAGSRYLNDIPTCAKLQESWWHHRQEQHTQMLWICWTVGPVTLWPHTYFHIKSAGCFTLLGHYLDMHPSSDVLL